MWPGMVSLRQSIMAASVVLLPAPVEPTIKSRPRLAMMISPRIGGTFRVDSGGIVLGM